MAALLGSAPGGFPGPCPPLLTQVKPSEPVGPCCCSHRWCQQLPWVRGRQWAQPWVLLEGKPRGLPLGTAQRSPRAFLPSREPPSRPFLPPLFLLSSFVHKNENYAFSKQRESTYPFLSSCVWVHSKVQRLILRLCLAFWFIIVVWLALQYIW